MSKEPWQARGMATAVVAVVTLLSMTARAADPNHPAVNKATTQNPPKVSPSKPPTPAKPTPASFTPEMSFGEAMDILRNSTTPPLNIIVLWREIGENAGVYRETPIGIDGAAGLRAGQYLELLLLSLSGSAATKLGYTVKGGVITVGTMDSLEVSRRVTRVYDVSDLVAEPARYFLPPMGFGGMGSGGPMMGPVSGYGGGYGAGSAPGISYMSRGISRDRGLSNAIDSLNRGTRRSGPRRR